jgi:DNA-binding PadR family transcriptional regulator
MLRRLEARGLIQGRWLERPGEMRRRYYRLTPEGRRFLRKERAVWREFVAVVSRIVGVEHA